MIKRHASLLFSSSLLLSAAATAAPAVIENGIPIEPEQASQSLSKEEIPDDIWSTIASPFDPITTAPGYAPPHQRVEQMRPQQPPVQAAPIRPQPAPVAVTAPTAPVRPAPVAPQPPTRYPVQPIAAPAPIPYELPPVEKVVAAEYPEEYWNCLLNNLQGVGSDVAAKLITRACQKKHPKR